MFAPQDYELAARILGLPVPMSAAEKAAAAPMTALVLRKHYLTEGPMPGESCEFIDTGATSNLNSYPRTEDPRLRNQIGHRMIAGTTTDAAQDELNELLTAILHNPSLVRVLIDFLNNLQTQQDEAGAYLSAQRPLEFDLPNYGSNYSVLNAPGSSMIPPSRSYQELG